MDTNQLRFIRAMKPLRWFKLARVIKLNKAGAAVDFTVDYFSIAPSFHRLLSLCGGMFGPIHLAACVSWLVKVSLASPCIVLRSSMTLSCRDCFVHNCFRCWPRPVPMLTNSSKGSTPQNIKSTLALAKENFTSTASRSTG